MIETLVGRVFATRSAAHLAHFATKSYAQHVALGEFYEGLIGQIDEIVEVYQGKFGLIEPRSVPAMPWKVSEIGKHLAAEVEWIEANKKQISRDCEAVQNLIDELAALYHRTVYKMENLR